MKKEELAKQYVNKKLEEWPHNWPPDFRQEDLQKAYEEGFDAGRTDAVESIWHKKTECPTKETRCILIATHGGFMARERIEQMEDWQRWAYIEDLLPKIPEPLEVVKGFYMKKTEGEVKKEKRK